MLRRLSSPLFLVGIFVGGLPSTACKSEQQEAKPTTTASPTVLESLPPNENAPAKIEIGFKPTPEQEAQAKALGATVSDGSWRLRGAEATDPANAELLVYLAATSDEVKVRGAALDAMARVFGNRANQVPPSDDFIKVVSGNLRVEDTRVAGRALEATRAAIGRGQANDALLDEVTALSRTDPFKSGPERYALLQTILGYGPEHDKKVFPMIIDSLDVDEHYVAAYALQGLARNFRRIPDRQIVLRKMLELTQHREPVVRGLALEVLGLTSKNMDDAVAAAMTGIKDESPFVRSEAARALGRMMHKPAIHELIKLLDDTATDYIDLQGWTTLDRTAGRMRTRTTASGTVRESVVTAIANLAGAELKLKPQMPNDPQASLDENAKAVRAWYAKAKGSIPKTSEPSPNKTTQEAADKTPAKIDNTQRAVPASTTTEPANPAP